MEHGYFNNPEIKKNSIILFIIISIFLIINLIFMKFQYDNLKEDYSERLGAIAYKVIEKDPEIKDDIIPIVTNSLSKEDKLKGIEFISQYGVNKDLENQVFPSLNRFIYKNNLFVFISIAVLFLILFLCNYMNSLYFYKKIRGLTVGADNVIKGEYDIAIDEDVEGDFAKLAVSFNSMRNIIRNNIYELEKEKNFLVDLLSDISHQLKTPLSSMIVYNDIMLSKELSKQQSETFLISNKNQLLRMDWLIKSLLKLARLDAKAIEFNKVHQSLNETVKESVETMEDRAKDNKIKISYQEICEVDLYHDRNWMEEALNNIIKNCIEHTEKGGEIEIKLYEKPAFKRISIKDNGEGIEEKDLANIFKRFYKAKTLKKTKTESIGIGLALTKSIIESHDGIIEVKSKLGEGTEFNITL
ncbi:MAG: ATP-binding protein [Clostridiaceae bacterium]